MLNGPSFIPQTVKKILILLHGYGADGHDLFAFGKILTANIDQIAIYSPHAIEAFEFSSFGYQWFGLPDLTECTIEVGIHKALPPLRAYIDALISEHNLTERDVFLFGFSQGCMMALSLLYYHDFGGIIGVSGMFVKPQHPAIVSPKTPVLLVHGTFDMVVPYAFAQIAKLRLEEDGVNVTLLTCPGLGHAIDDYILKEGQTFLKNVL